MINKYWKFSYVICTIKGLTFHQYQGQLLSAILFEAFCIKCLRYNILVGWYGISVSKIKIELFLQNCEVNQKRTVRLLLLEVVIPWNLPLYPEMTNTGLKNIHCGGRNCLTFRTIWGPFVSSMRLPCVSIFPFCLGFFLSPFLTTISKFSSLIGNVTIKCKTRICMHALHLIIVTL